MSAANVAAASAAPAESGANARRGVFLAAFVLALVTLEPFADLRAALPTSQVTGQASLTYFAFLAVAGAGVALARRYARPGLEALKRPPIIALGLWIACTALISYDPSTSLKRAALCLLVAATAALTPLLPRGRDEMAKLIMIAVAVPIVLSYLGILLWPQFSIHSYGDTLEPELAGDWRGIFAHKNIAAPMFGLFAFCGIYLVRIGRRREGLAIAIASLVFVLFAHGKTSTALWAPAAIAGVWFARRPVGALASALALAPPLAISALGFGAQLSSSFAALAASLPFDSSFTGRADVWRFAAFKLMERPLFGYGFDSFWDDPSLRANAEEGWVANAAHAHNGYVDATLAMGLVGLGLTLWALVWQPLKDLGEAVRRGADPALTGLCAQIWLYGVWVSSLETFLFDRANPEWFLFLFAIFSLRYLATFRIAP